MASVSLYWLMMLRLLAALAAGSSGAAALVAHAPTAAHAPAPDASGSSATHAHDDARSAPRLDVPPGAPANPGAIWDRAPGQLGAILRGGRLQRDGGARPVPPSVGGPAHATGVATPDLHAARASLRTARVLAVLPTRHVAATRMGALHYYPTAPPSGS